MKTINCIIFVLILILVINMGIHSQNVAITNNANYTAHESAMLDVNSTTKGILVPRLTTTLRIAINSPATGLLVFDTDLGKFYYYDGSEWKPLFSGNETDPDVGANTINYVPRWDGTALISGSIFDNGAFLGIGTSTPADKLDVIGNIRAQRFADGDNADYWVDPAGSGDDENNGARYADGIRTDVNTTRNESNGGSNYPIIIRQFITTNRAIGTVIAQTPDWELRRTGASELFELVPKNTNNTTYWFKHGDTFVQGDNPGIGTSVIINTGSNRNCEIWFGYPYSTSGHFCHIQISRFNSDFFWNGTITTTYSNN